MQEIIIHLDCDKNGDDLRDSAGNPIPAGWYRYAWPLLGVDGRDPAGPFDSLRQALGRAAR